MDSYKITDEMRKMLTEFLGECWHIKKEPRTMAGYVCSKCEDFIKWGSGYDVNGNRTFTSDSDMLAVFRKIRDDGKWGRFWDWAYIRFVFNDDMGDNASWLFLDNPERACCLAADFLEEQGT